MMESSGGDDGHGSSSFFSSADDNNGPDNLVARQNILMQLLSQQQPQLMRPSIHNGPPNSHRDMLHGVRDPTNSNTTNGQMMGAPNPSENQPVGLYGSAYHQNAAGGVRDEQPLSLYHQHAQNDHASSIRASGDVLMNQGPTAHLSQSATSASHLPLQQQVGGVGGSLGFNNPSLVFNPYLSTTDASSRISNHGHGGGPGHQPGLTGPGSGMSNHSMLNDDEFLTRVLLARRQHQQPNHQHPTNQEQPPNADELMRMYSQSIAAAAQNSLLNNSFPDQTPGGFQTNPAAGQGGVLPGQQQEQPYSQSTGLRNPSSILFNTGHPTHFASMLGSTGNLNSTGAQQRMAPSNLGGMRLLPTETTPSSISFRGDASDRIEPHQSMLSDVLHTQQRLLEEASRRSQLMKPGGEESKSSLLILPAPTRARKRRKSQRKKPADMPRRPLSAYNLFFSEERERILQEIADEERGHKRAKTDGDHRQDTVSKSSEADASKPSNAPPDITPDEDREKPKISLSKTTCQALLRPLVPSAKKRRPHRKTHGKISFKNLAQMVGQRWKLLVPERRKYYQSLADEDMKRHKAAMEEYYRKQAESQQSSTSQDDAARRASDEKADDGDSQASDNEAGKNQDPLGSDESATPTPVAS